jgi:hypothetical protein
VEDEQKQFNSIQYPVTRQTAVAVRGRHHSKLPLLEAAFLAAAT